MNILIIGKNSYIGDHIDKWLSQAGHQVQQLDVLTDKWRTFDYSPFDVIVHVAGIVHRPDCKDWDLYKRVNTDMPIAIAEKFKASSANKKQYVYFSTMGVYEAAKSLSGCIIEENTPLLDVFHSSSYYGKSKLLAEFGLTKLQDSSFDVAFVRPPSVYGNGCKGGYIKSFRSIAQRLPFIPLAYENALQSFVYIDNLCECVRIIIENNLKGLFCPQDDEIPNANRLLEVICKCIGKNYRASKSLGMLMRLCSFIPLVTKAYGGISYSRSISEIKGYNYVVVPFAEGMNRTVQTEKHM